MQNSDIIYLNSGNVPVDTHKIRLSVAPFQGPSFHSNSSISRSCL